MDSKTISTVAENHTSSTKNDFVSSKNITDENYNTTAISDIDNIETLTNIINYTEFDCSSMKNPSTTADIPIHYLDDKCDNLKVKKALSHMSINELDQFLNVYKKVTNPDLNIDKIINNFNNISTKQKQKLSDALLNNEYLDNQHTTELEDLIIEDYTLFDVRDHIEGWKTRILPMIKKIENLTKEYNT